MCIAAPSAEWPANCARYASNPRRSLRLSVSLASVSLYSGAKACMPMRSMSSALARAPAANAAWLSGGAP